MVLNAMGQHFEEVKDEQLKMDRYSPFYTSAVHGGSAFRHAPPRNVLTPYSARKI